MADTKVSALTAVASFLLADELPVNEAGVSKKVTGLQMQTTLVLGNQSTALQTPTAATLTYLTNSNIAVPVGKLRVGTWFRWHLDYTKTAAGAAARTYDVRVGTAGTTADTAVITYTTPASTAAADSGFTDIYVTCRGPLSASGIFAASFFSGHSLQTTGLLNVQMHYNSATSAVFDVTTANLIVGITTTSAASEAISYSQVQVEAHNL